MQPQRTSRTVDGVRIPEIHGYRVRRAITLRADGLGAFDVLLRAAAAAGANYVHGVDFRTTDLRRYRDQARAEAIQPAREKAEALAAGLGQTLGAPLSISERGPGWNVGSAWGGGFDEAMQRVRISAVTFRRPWRRARSRPAQAWT